MYNVKDNAEAKLQVWLSSLATTLVVELGNGMLFPDAPFLAVLNKRDNDWKITKSEKVEVTAKDWDQFTVNRGYQWTTPQDFNAWDYFSLFVLAKHIQELQEEVSTSAKSKSIANVYSNESTYAVWNIVMYKWERYRCTTVVTTAEEFNSNKWTKVSIQSNLDTLNTWVDTLTTRLNHIETDWIVTPYLSQTLCIWETYTASDKLFLHHSPIESDCWDIAYAIWDNAVRTQVHIQRIASWKASNQLKLMVRNIWSPTTRLICKIQRWVRTTVATNETWRYWDWTTIATAEITYSTFSKAWQVVTFTFDHNFWETRWELLDVVVAQQDDIVNASNYYEIACDKTQYWEAYRLIQVNWTTRTYTKFMPYCDSLAFEWSVVWKEKTATYTANAVVTHYQAFSWGTSSGYSSVNLAPANFAVNTTFLRWRVIVSGRLQVSMTVWSSWVDFSSWYIEVQKASWDAINFNWYKSSGWSSYFSSTAELYYYLSENATVPIRTDKPKIYVDWISSVWTPVTAIFFWLIWFDWWDGGYWEIVTPATT